jgi:cytochrome d ubiquinol oxidase subunit II
MNLEILWYIVIITAMMCYIMLDGFDMGVGALHLFVKKDQERRVFLNAIGPVWDGNEVWLVIVIGALFAGFPDVYATLLSSFYMLIMLFICGLIFRACAIEFRSKQESPKWRQVWDVVFSVSSAVIAFGAGVILGNLIVGIPLDPEGAFLGSFSELFGFYPVLVGFLTVFLCMMHGSIYLVMKTEGALHLRLRKWVNRIMVGFLGFYVLTTIVTLMNLPHMIERMVNHPCLFALPLCALLAILNVPRLIHRGQDGRAFIFSCLSIVFFLSLFAVGTFPEMIRSTLNAEENSLTVFNSASSPLTLKVLLIIVAIGLPLVFAYGVYIYRTFRGKVKIEKHSY